MQNIQIKIEGMSCNHCVMAVKNALNKFDLKNLKVEIGKVEFDIEDQTTKEEEIKAAIEEVGYKVL